MPLPKNGTSQVFARASPPPFENTFVHSCNDKKSQLSLSLSLEIRRFHNIPLFSITYKQLLDAYGMPNGTKFKKQNWVHSQKVHIKVIDKKFLNMRPILYLSFCTIWPSIDVCSDLYVCSCLTAILRTLYEVGNSSKWTWNYVQYWTSSLAVLYTEFNYDFVN